MYTKYKIVPFCPYHFVRTILSNTILSVYHFVHTILSATILSGHPPNTSTVKQSSLKVRKSSLVNTAEDRLLSSVIHNSYHVLRLLFPPIVTRRPGLRKRAHPFTLPLKDDKQCIPRVLYRALLPPVQS